MKSKELIEIEQAILREQASRKPMLQTAMPKTTQTPFGAVHSKLLSLKHNKALRKGEILAQWVRDKKTGKREKFVWLGVIESCTYDPINLYHKILYRPFCSQTEQEEKRMRQIYTNQMY